MKQPLVEGIFKCMLANFGSLTEHSTGQNCDPVYKPRVLSYRRRKNVKDSLRSESGYEVCVRRHACQMKETKDCFAG